MRALVAVADYAEDPFRPMCIQTLAEIREWTYFRTIVECY